GTWTALPGPVAEPVPCLVRVVEFNARTSAVMSYFSRLTDIVTCNLTELLSRADDPPAALREIVAEMEEGVAGAKRSVATAEAHRKRLRQEIADQQSQQSMWADRARDALKSGDEPGAR